MLPGLASTTLDMTPRQAKEERALRKNARQNFLAFCQYLDPRYETPAHIQLLAAKLQQIALYIASGGTKGIGRLMIMMPPQHGKSQIASRNFPAWLLGLLPDSRIILTSYAVEPLFKRPIDRHIAAAIHISMHSKDASYSAGL